MDAEENLTPSTQPGPSMTPRPPGRKRKHTNEGAMQKVLETLQELDKKESEDQDIIFGQFVASYLKSMKNKKKKEICRLKIHELLVQYDSE